MKRGQNATSKSENINQQAPTPTKPTKTTTLSLIAVMETRGAFLLLFVRAAEHCFTLLLIASQNYTLGAPFF